MKSLDIDNSLVGTSRGYSKQKASVFYFALTTSLALFDISSDVSIHPHQELIPPSSPSYIINAAQDSALEGTPFTDIHYPFIE